MTRTTIDNTESVLDSRDIIERIEELEAERENYTTQNAEHGVTPEMIDAAIIQLSTMFDSVPGIPDDVKESGRGFVASLEKWSAAKKAERDALRAAGQPAQQA